MRQRDYLEDNNILVNEQNELRRNRLRENHIFKLNSAIQNNDELFEAFIDLRNCFDIIDRDMMFINVHVDGKIYNL